MGGFGTGRGSPSPRERYGAQYTAGRWTYRLGSARFGSVWLGLARSREIAPNFFAAPEWIRTVHQDTAHTFLGRATALYIAPETDISSNTAVGACFYWSQCDFASGFAERPR